MVDSDSNGEEDYVVERIDDVTYDEEEKSIMYLVKWKGFDESQSTWEPEEHLDNCKLILQDFKRKNAEHMRVAETHLKAQSRQKEFEKSGKTVRSKVAPEQTELKKDTHNSCQPSSSNSMGTSTGFGSLSNTDIKGRKSSAKSTPKSSPSAKKLKVLTSSGADSEPQPKKLDAKVTPLKITLSNKLKRPLESTITVTELGSAVNMEQSAKKKSKMSRDFTKDLMPLQKESSSKETKRRSNSLQAPSTSTQSTPTAKKKSTSVTTPAQTTPQPEKEKQMVQKKSTSLSTPSQAIRQPGKEKQMVRKKASSGSTPAQTTPQPEKEGQAVQKKASSGSTPGQTIPQPEKERQAVQKKSTSVTAPVQTTPQPGKDKQVIQKKSTSLTAPVQSTPQPKKEMQIIQKKATSSMTPQVTPQPEKETLEKATNSMPPQVTPQPEKETLEVQEKVSGLITPVPKTPLSEKERQGMHKDVPTDIPTEKMTEPGTSSKSEASVENSNKTIETSLSSTTCAIPSIEKLEPEHHAKLLVPVDPVKITKTDTSVERPTKNVEVPTTSSNNAAIDRVVISSEPFSGSSSSLTAKMKTIRLPLKPPPLPKDITKTLNDLKAVQAARRALNTEVGSDLTRQTSPDSKSENSSSSSDSSSAIVANAQLPVDTTKVTEPPAIVVETPNETALSPITTEISSNTAGTTILTSLKVPTRSTSATSTTSTSSDGSVKKRGIAKKSIALNGYPVPRGLIRTNTTPDTKAVVPDSVEKLEKHMVNTDLSSLEKTDSSLSEHMKEESNNDGQTDEKATPAVFVTAEKLEKCTERADSSLSQQKKEESNQECKLDEKRPRISSSAKNGDSKSKKMTRSDRKRSKIDGNVIAGCFKSLIASTSTMPTIDFEIPVIVPSIDIKDNNGLIHRNGSFNAEPQLEEKPRCLLGFVSIEEAAKLKCPVFKRSAFNFTPSDQERKPGDAFYRTGRVMHSGKSPSFVPDVMNDYLRARSVLATETVDGVQYVLLDYAHIPHFLSILTLDEMIQVYGEKVAGMLVTRHLFIPRPWNVK